MTLNFKNVYIKNAYTLLGRNEYVEGIKADESLNDYYLDEKCFEMGEVDYQVKTLNGLLKKEKLKEKDIDILIGGDLQNQLFATYYANRKFDISSLGVYSACASFNEGLIVASSLLENQKVNNVIVTVSSHNLASEKQFRFPIEYGALKKKVCTFTSTGSVSALVTNKKTEIKIESATIGKVTDIGYSDANNMGACMAPSAAKTIYEHLKETNRTPDYYDLILTGDLGIYGIKILEEYLEKEYKLKINGIKDAGVMLFNKESGRSIAGGSGPLCLPLILFTKILKEKYKKILLVGTGSLHSKLSTNINESIPSVSHAVSLEVNYDLH